VVLVPKARPKSIAPVRKPRPTKSRPGKSRPGKPISHEKPGRSQGTRELGRAKAGGRNPRFHKQSRNRK